MAFDDEIKREIRRSLGLESPAQGTTQLSEAYVVEPKSYTLKTEFLSDKTKKARLDEFERFSKALNRVSAQLDTASRDAADTASSEFRSLKMDESHCINRAFLQTRFFSNIDDPKSQIGMDSITFMRLERDFGTFDEWQKDFIACGMSARSGYVVTSYNMMLRRYVNHVVDGSGCGLPVGTFPIVVLDVSEGAYYRDYVDDRKTYIVAMMKELNWEVIEDRVKKAERIAKVLS